MSEDGWKIDPQLLDEEFSKHTQQNKILILTNPDNPTGTAYTPKENEKIANVCRKHNAFILSDEIYSLLHYNQEHDSIYKVCSSSMLTPLPCHCKINLSVKDFDLLRREWKENNYKLGQKRFHR